MRQEEKVWSLRHKGGRKSSCRSECDWLTLDLPLAFAAHGSVGSQPIPFRFLPCFRSTPKGPRDQALRLPFRKKEGSPPEPSVTGPHSPAPRTAGWPRPPAAPALPCPPSAPPGAAGNTGCSPSAGTRPWLPVRAPHPSSSGCPEAGSPGPAARAESTRPLWS